VNFYSLPLEKRMRRAERRKERYSSDPEFRERKRRQNAEAQARYRARHRQGAGG
jgi:hypothetical protein